MLPASMTRPPRMAPAAVPAGPPLAAAPAPMPAPSLAAPVARLFHSPVGPISVFLALTFLWITYSRLPELISLLIGGRVPLAQLASAMMVLVILANMRAFVETFSTRGCTLLLCYTLWLVCTIPTSTWRGGAVGTFTDNWLRSLFVFFAIAPFLQTTEHIRKASVAFVFGVSVIGLFSLRLARTIEGRSAMGGTLGNSNDYAVHILLAVPIGFFLLANKQNAIFTRLVSGITLMWILLTAAKSGSRTALLVVVTTFLLAFWFASASKKVIITIVTFLIFALGILLLPSNLRSRYGTLFGGDVEVEDMQTASSAEASTAERRRLFWYSFQLALKNPIFGVGMGNFTAQATTASEGTGEKVFWRAAHTIYGQLAAEVGFVGLALYLAVAFHAMAICVRVRRWTARLPQETLLFGLASVWLIVQASYAVSSIFGTSTYGAYLPMFLAISVALERVARRAVAPAPAYAPAGVPLARFPGNA